MHKGRELPDHLTNQNQAYQLKKLNTMGEKRPRFTQSPDTAPRKIARTAPLYKEARISSNTNSRQSSISINNEDMNGYGTPRSRSPATRNGTPSRADVEVLPKALQKFVLAVSQEGQTLQHLSNVQADFDEMEPKCAAFPALRGQKNNRVLQAKKDSDAAQADARSATTILLDALYKCFPEHQAQHYVSRADYETLAADNRALKKRMENLEKLVNRLDEDNRQSCNSAFDRISKGDAFMKSLEKDAKSVREQIQSDRSSFRSRYTTLEDQMARTKAKQMEFSTSISQNNETIQSLRDNIEEIKSLKNNPDGPQPYKLEARCNQLEEDVKRLDSENVEKDDFIDQQITALDEKLKENLDALESRMMDVLESRMTDVESKFTALDETKSKTDTALEELAAIKQECAIPAEFKADMVRLGLLVETHVDVLQRHETRINSVTTDEMVRLMEHQWRTTYGPGDKLQALIGRLQQLEQQSFRRITGIERKLSEMAQQIDANKNQAKPASTSSDSSQEQADLARRLEAVEKILPEFRQRKYLLNNRWPLANG